MKTVAIVGLGDISAIHLAAVASLPGLRLAAVCDCEESARAKAPPDVPFYTDYEVMAAEVKPDCVHLCLPHHLHYTAAARLAEMGCHILCEKPLAVSVQEAEAFALLEQAHPGLQTGICLQNRLNETSRMLKEIVDSGEYGAVVGAKGLVPWARPAAYYQQKPWRGRMGEAGGGLMMNQAIHTLDLLQWICGPVSQVHASCAQLLDYGIEVEDSVTARLSFAHGAKGLFWGTVANYENESTQLTVALEKAVFHIEDNRLVRREAEGPPTLLCEDVRLPGTKFYYGAGHTSLICQFYAAMENGSGDYIHAAEGLSSIRLIDAIVRSSQEKTLLDVVL